MRIIAGELGGRRLATPKGRSTRPMLDRVREAVFSSLGADVVDARVLDLFAGTGSLGLEAASRGAARVRFVETGRGAAKLIAKNVAALELGDRTELREQDALSPSSWSADSPWDLVFFDPPYPLWSSDRERLFGALQALFAELAPGGTIVVHTPRRALEPDAFGAFDPRGRDYGSTTIWYLAAPADEGPEDGGGVA